MGIGVVALLTIALDVSGWLMPHSGCCTPGKEPVWMSMEIWRKGNPFLPPEFELWTIQHIVNFYTNYHSP